MRVHLSVGAYFYFMLLNLSVAAAISTLNARYDFLYLLAS